MKITTLLAAVLFTALAGAPAQATSGSADLEWFFYEFENLQNFFDDPLMYAADRGYTEVVQSLLSELPEAERADTVLAKDREGWTLLMEAAQSGSGELTQFLVNAVPTKDRQTYILHKSHDGTTALMAAAMAEQDNWGASEVLISSLAEHKRAEYLADTRRNNAHALIIAIVNRHEGLAEYLIKTMPKEQLVSYLFVQDDRGRSALIWSAVTDMYHTAKALIEALPEDKRKEYVALKTPHGESALDYARVRVASYLQAFL